MNDSISAELLGRFGAGLSQHARLITLETAQGGVLPESLVAEAMVAREAVNELFSIEVIALSVSAQVDVSALLGEELTVTLLQPDHSRRAWHGICTASDHLGADGGMARYRLLLEPALAELRLRGDSWIFQNKDVRAVVMELLADYPLVRCGFDIGAALPVRAIRTQHEESDFAFFARVLASAGLSWRFEHAPAGTDERHGKHKLVVFDARAVPPMTPGGDVLRFHGVRAPDSDDAIDRFGARRELRANAVAVSSWDPAQVVAPASERCSSLDAGEVPSLSIYEGGGERLLEDQAQADARSDAMLKAIELENKTFDGAGAVRRLAAGYRFTLSQHARFGRGLDEFTVTAVRHEARNNFQPGLRSDPGIEAGTYRNSFTCVRSSVAIVPPAAAARRPPTAPGPQSALVVGLDNSVATTNRDHQVLVQFGWQRGRRPNHGGLAHDVDADGCAPGNDGSGTWVRVAEAMAGPNWGTVFTPRIGTETLIDFVDGDIDRPVVVSQLYNGVDRPPFPGGVDSGVDHPGVLSGIHSPSFDGAGFTQWVVDDTAGQLRMRLASSCANTQLNLGYLVEQSPTSSRRGDYRGSGFEMRTDAWAVIRGGEGVFLTTAARAAHACGVESTQMDAAEAIARFKASQQLCQLLSTTTAQQAAVYSGSAAKAGDEFIDRLDSQYSTEHIKNAEEKRARIASSGSRDPDEQPKNIDRSTITIDSTAGVICTSHASTAVYAGGTMKWVLRADVQLTAQNTCSSISAEAASMLTHDGGVTAIAARGQTSLQAHTNKLEIIAEGAIIFLSINESIDVLAEKQITMKAGDSAISLTQTDITFACRGEFKCKGGHKVIDQGLEADYAAPAFPGTTAAAHLIDDTLAYNEQFRLVDSDGETPLIGRRYVISGANGQQWEGTSDKDGLTHRIYTSRATELTIKIMPSQDEEKIE